MHCRSSAGYVLKAREKIFWLAASNHLQHNMQSSFYPASANQQLESLKDQTAQDIIVKITVRAP